VKRIITDNTDAHGGLNTDAVQRAILQYRNNPDPNTKLSPAQCVFGHTIKDLIQIPLQALSHVVRTHEKITTSTSS
jgi:hypothetical protein